MGLFQNAIKTYDNMNYLAGVYIDGQKSPLAPIGYISTKAAIEITININSDFIKAEKVDELVLIPSTQESMGRSSAPSPHPLCDNIGYLSGIDSKKKSLYLNQLNDWICFDKENKILSAIYNYVQSDKVLSDLDMCNLLLKDENNKLKNEKDLVVWTVIDLNRNEAVQTWKNKTIMESYYKYYANKLSNENKNVCMISGENAIVASQHIKGIFSLNGNAKLISAKDDGNFKYLGRFIEKGEACTVSYEASQKAHNALKWLISNQGDIIGGRCFVCWNPEGIKVPKVTRPSFIGKEKEQKIKPSNYKQELSKALNSYRTNLPDSASVVIAAFDAATNGRLSLAYYNEIKASDFLERLESWDTTCCWVDYNGNTYSPSLSRITNFSFGTAIESKGKMTMKADDKIVAPVIQHLISSRIDQAKFPKNIMHNIFHKSNNIQIYENLIRRDLLFTACAVIKKYRYDHFKEEWKMALEPEKKDRSYQYGRLLAVLEKIERDTYDLGESRETNAIRMQGVFVNRPAYATKILIDKLKTSYYPRLSPSTRIWYEKLVGEIMAVISEFSDKEYNKSLSETYLLGYYLQKNNLYAKKELKTESNENSMEE